MSRIQTHKIASFCFVYHQNNEGYAVFLQGFSFNKHAAGLKTPKGCTEKMPQIMNIFINIMNRFDKRLGVVQKAWLGSKGLAWSSLWISMLISRLYSCQIDWVIRC